MVKRTHCKLRYVPKNVKGWGKKKKPTVVKKLNPNKNPSAAELEKELGNINHFGAIFSSKQLKNIIILKYPITLLVIVKKHWIVIYIDQRTIEVYDSLMNICEYDQVLLFIKNNIHSKELKLFPKIQADNNLDCAFFAKFFIKAKANLLSFEDLLKIFGCDFKYNATIVRNGFDKTFISTR